MAITPQELVADAKSKIKELDPVEAVHSIKSGALVLDVREPAEYEAGKLADAVNIPRGVLEFKIADHPTLANTDATIVVYCKTGGRSALAVLSLQQLGYSNVHSIRGGIEAWSGNGHPVVK